MSKELTEKWKDGELPEDCYYILTKNGHIRKDRTCFYSHTDEQCFCFTSNKDIKEVLAPVPTYEEWKTAKEQLVIAVKALKGVSLWANTGNGGEQAVKKVCDKALKEMEGVK